MLTRVARLAHVLQLVHWAAHRNDVPFIRFEDLMVAPKNEHEALADDIAIFRTAKVLPSSSPLRSHFEQILTSIPFLSPLPGLSVSSRDRNRWPRPSAWDLSAPPGALDKISANGDYRRC
jgi:hypothetical protein